MDFVLTKFNAIVFSQVSANNFSSPVIIITHSFNVFCDPTSDVFSFFSRRKLGFKSINSRAIITADNPASLLSVSSSTPIISIENTGVSSSGGLQFKNSGTLKGVIAQTTVAGQIINSSSVGDLNIRTASANIGFSVDAGTTENVRIASNGYVGIGSTNPQYKLDVLGQTRVGPTVTATANSGLVVGYTGIGSMYGIDLRPTTAGGATALYFENSGGSLQGTITINGSGTTSYNTTSDYRLKENVNPLVGALDRIARLEPKRFYYKADENKKTIDGFIAHEVQAVIPEAVTGVKDAVDQKGKPIYQQLDLSKIVPLTFAGVRELNKKVEPISSDSEGNVGIGVLSPNYKLDVQGGDINTSGSVRASGVALASDARYKRDIEPLDNSLEKILNIRGVSYNWRTEEFNQKHFNDRHQIGVIAQEVETQFPELVETNKDGYKSVNYPALVAPLIEAVKSLYNRLIGIEETQTSQSAILGSMMVNKADKAVVDSKIQKLEEENKAKDKKIKELEQKLNQIEKALNLKNNSRNKSVL